MPCFITALLIFLHACFHFAAFAMLRCRQRRFAALCFAAMLLRHADAAMRCFFAAIALRDAASHVLLLRCLPCAVYRRHDSF